MTRHLVRPRMIGVLVTVALVAALCSLVWARAGAGSDPCAVRAERAAERADLITGTGPRVLVIGDSYAVGAGVGPARSWPTRLPGRVRVDAFSGSGFSVGASTCGDLSYAARAPRALRHAPDLVVIEGGLNDFDQPIGDLEAGFAGLMQELDGIPVLVVGPPPAPRRPLARLQSVDAALADLAAAHRASYLSMLGVELSYLDDDLHPDPAGHRLFGDLVADQLRSTTFPNG